MTRANGEYIIVNDDIGVYRNKNKVVKTTFDFDGLSIPLLLMGTDVESCLNELDEIVRPKIGFSYAKRDIENNIKKDTETHTKLSLINKIKNKIKKVAN